MNAQRARGSFSSAIGRPIDLKVGTNRAIALLTIATLAVATVTLLLLGEPIGPSLLRGLAMAGAVFLAWALGREIAPDHQASAFLASAGALAGELLLGGPSFLLLFWFLVGLRLVNRSTGRDPTPIDVAAFCGLTVWLGILFHWIVAFLGLPVLLFAGLGRFPRTLRWILAGFLPVTGLGIGFARGWPTTLPDSWSPAVLVWVAIALAAIPAVAGLRKLQSVGDQDGQALDASRARWALVWVLASGGILVAFTSLSLQDWSPLAAALTGMLIGSAVQRYGSIRRQRQSTD